MLWAPRIKTAICRFFRPYFTSLAFQSNEKLLYGFRLFNSLVIRSMSAAEWPLAVRKKVAISRGCSRMIFGRSAATRPASARNSSASWSRALAMAMTFSSAGGRKSPRSTFERYVGTHVYDLGEFAQTDFLRGSQVPHCVAEGCC